VERGFREIRNHISLSVFIDPRASISINMAGVIWRSVPTMCAMVSMDIHSALLAPTKVVFSKAFRALSIRACYRLWRWWVSHTLPSVPKMPSATPATTAHSAPTRFASLENQPRWPYHNWGFHKHYPNSDRQKELASRKNWVCGNLRRLVALLWRL